MSAPVWPAKFLEVIRERDQARRIAVQLEQENARLEHMLAATLLVLEDAGLLEDE